MNRREFLAGAAGTSALALTSTTATAQEDGEGSDPRQGSGTKDDPYIVEMRTESSEYYFDPVGIYVEPGDTIQWVNASGDHSTTSYTTDNPQSSVRRIPDGADSWNSGTLQEDGATFTHTFETPGTYDYYCIPHKTLGMVARLVVGEPGGPAAEGSIPNDVGSGIVPDSKTIVEQKALSYPYIPNTGASSLPGLAVGALTLFGLGNAYMLSEYDVLSGRYKNSDDTQTGLE
ncbi:plastocyanin/azurin family copper-binding protein [Salarchaeum sp. JOR-1]|uniref:plastocyanin/azurin family copper-binding protein n=1 Tax=Salarchaeum sp. JOR-1 TaxID=2599399 RepID=UPI001198A662|nr:plastocyanin/azurin family copper-binding protein [Salarchaeum sp. JOR-1]QDX40077.1 halocyanin [Salarchaeum sp. JOR-1]